MIGAIAGDIIGSVYEFANFKEYDFPLFSKESFFTDDTVLTVAVADALIHKLDIAKTLKAYALKYPNRGYGNTFYEWIHSTSLTPYNSWGNGSAMRTSSIGFFFNNETDVLKAAREFAEVTHNHPEGIKGAQATAYAIYLARQGCSKEEIKNDITQWFHYDLSRTLDEIRPDYVFDVSCQGSVPPAIIAFLESENFEDAVRKAVSLGGDADTLGCIAGSIAEAYYGQVPEEIAVETMKRLPEEFRKIIDKFYMMLGG
ncbi:MAG: ADP-ribosylglycohydrolase family protein [Anaerolineaceae bacterium]|jgi:ADP-ribosylglycohydrolase|nr:ADP-ribosylglycohydrolase family protein [Anaerolineaceae bacterium]